MNFKYNEEQYGEEIYTNGFQTDYINSELTILVKYLKQIKNFKKKETEEFLYKFCEKHIEGFNKINYYKSIDKAILKGRKGDNKLITIKSISIYKEEMEYIDSLEIDHEYKKLLLVFLVNKKISLEIKRLNYCGNEMSTYFEGNKKRYGSIFKAANISGKLKIDEMIHELVNKNIIQSIIKGGIILEYLYPLYEIREEVIQVKNKITDKIEDKIKKIIVYDIKNYELYEEISDFENIGFVFDFYKEINNVKKCDNFRECKRLIRVTNNKIKYCKSCAEEKEKTRKREWKRNNKEFSSEIGITPKPLI